MNLRFYYYYYYFKVLYFYGLIYVVLSFEVLEFMIKEGFKAGLIRGGILFLDATYATCSVGLRAIL